MFCKKCGTPLNSDMRFCKKCGTPVNAPPEPPRAIPLDEAPLPRAIPLDEAPLPRAIPLDEAPPYQPYQATPVYEPTPARAINRRLLWIGLAVAAVLAAGGYWWYSRAALERKLEDAVARGNLTKPAGKSALDYYQQLKQRGLSDGARRQWAEKLTPQITARPMQMMADLSTPNQRAEATLSDWQDAQAVMNWASEMQPNDNKLAARASYCAGRAAYLDNRKDEALTAWKRAAEQDAAWALPLNGSGLIYNERKNYATARSCFFEAIRREPQFALPYNNIGTAFFYEKNDTQAERYYRQAIERAPQWPRPHVWLGDLAARRKAYDEAVREYETALNLDPTGTSGIDMNKLRQSLEQARGRSASTAAGEDSISYENVRGFIGTLRISFSFSYRNGQVTGSYRYEGRGESLRLTGSVSSDGVFTLAEFAPDGRQTGSIVFKGRPTDTAEVIYSGMWSSADGQRKLPFKLEPLGD